VVSNVTYIVKFVLAVTDCRSTQLSSADSAAVSAWWLCHNVVRTPTLPASNQRH